MSPSIADGLIDADPQFFGDLPRRSDRRRKLQKKPRRYSPRRQGDLLGGARSRGACVLIACSSSERAEYFVKSLRRRGFNVSIASSGMECVSHLRSGLFDALVLQPDLPWGGGAGVLAAMRDQDDVPSVPTILLVRLGESIPARWLASTVRQRLVESVSGAELTASVRQLLRPCQSGIEDGELLGAEPHNSGLQIDTDEFATTPPA